MSRAPAPAPPPAPSSPGVGDRILTTASELFYREGVRAVGIQRVIDEAGIAKASLYAHYASKDDLVAACLSRQGGLWRTAVEASFADPTLDARGKLLRIFDLQIARIADPGYRGCPFQNTGSEIAGAEHPARAIMVEYRQWLHRLFAALVREAGLDDAEAVTGALIVLFDGASASAQVDGRPDAARYARWAAAQMIAAHTPRQRSPRAPRRARVPPRKTSRRPPGR